LLNVNLYVLTQEVLTELNIPREVDGDNVIDGDLCYTVESHEVSEQEMLDLRCDLDALSKKYYGRINPSIREAMKQKGITLTKNLYCGFDTEYENVNMKTNNILSAQWAVSSKVLLTLPEIKDYELSGMNTHSGEEYALNPMWYDQRKINFVLLEEEIQGFVSRMRVLKGFEENDRAIQVLSSRLSKSGLPYYKSNGKIIFSFERSSIKTYIKTTGLEELDLERLVSIGQNLGGEDVNTQEEEVRSLLKDIPVFDDVELKESKNLLESDFTNLKAVSLEGENIKEVSEDVAVEEYKSSNKRARSQTRL
jgi:hypothetical protein